MNDDCKLEQKEEVCEWTNEYGVFEAGCGDKSFMMWYGFVFCPYCGKKIKFKGRE